MKTIFNALKSVRLAVVLIAFLAVTCVLATLVPQGREGEFYFANYPGLLGSLIVGSGFSNFFRSLLFLTPAALFFVNLFVCAVDRFVRERRKSLHHHGPDLLHLGILMLCLGGLLSFSGRQSGYVLLSRGDGVRLPGQRLLELTDFTYLAYADGRPRDWISTVRLYAGSKIQLASYAIRVNHPLKLGLLSIYQVSHEIRRALVLRDSQGTSHSLAQGEETEAGDATLYLIDPGQKGGQALVRVQDASGVRMQHLARGDAIGPLTVDDIRDLEFSGLEAVDDPGFPLVLVALIFVGSGLLVTFYQKFRETEEADA